MICGYIEQLLILYRPTNSERLHGAAEPVKNKCYKSQTQPIDRKDQKIMKEIKTTSPNNEESKNTAISTGRTNANGTQTTAENATGEKLNRFEYLYFAIVNAVETGEELTRTSLLAIYESESELDRDLEKLHQLTTAVRAEKEKGGEA